MSSRTTSSANISVILTGFARCGEKGPIQENKYTVKLLQCEHLTSEFNTFNLELIFIIAFP